MVSGERRKVPKIGDDGIPFSQRLKELRDARGWNHVELAAESGVSSQAIWKYENENAEPGFFNGMAIAKALRITPQQLAGEIDRAEIAAALNVDGSDLAHKIMSRLQAVEKTLMQTTETLKTIQAKRKPT